MAVDKLFFAAFPDPPIAAEVARLTPTLLAAEHLRGTPIAAYRLHVSLFGFRVPQDLPHDLVAAARRAAGTVPMPPFAVTFNAVGSFSRGQAPRPLVLYGDEGVVGFAMLQERLLAAMGMKANPNYTPHMTIAYGDALPTRRFVEAVTWTVRSFALVHSLVGKSRHVLLDKFPLRD